MLKKIAVIIIGVVFIALVFRASIVSGYWWVFWLLLLLALPLPFLKTESLKMAHAIAFWTVLGLIYLAPFYFPTTYDGVTARIDSIETNFGFWVAPDYERDQRDAERKQCEMEHASLFAEYEIERAEINAKPVSTERWKELEELSEDVRKLQKELNAKSFCSEYSSTTTPTPTPTPEPAATPSQGNSTSSGSSIFVNAKSYQGVQYGVVKNNSTLHIKGSGTSVWKNIPVGNPTKFEECGPDGTSPTNSPLISKESYMSNINDYLCPLALKGALIGKIGDGKWFPVGSNYKEEVKQGGMLVLAINDLDPQKQSISNWADNDKGIMAYVQNEQ